MITDKQYSDAIKTVFQKLGEDPELRELWRQDFSHHFRNGLFHGFGITLPTEMIDKGVNNLLDDFVNFRSKK